MKTFDSYLEEWERNAAKDAYWAVLTSSHYETRPWDKEAFFQSGRREIQLLREYIATSKLPIPFQGKALDFGCGTGRLTQALGAIFQEVCGVDISTQMISQAKDALPKDCRNIDFILNPSPHLGQFKDNRFDFIYSNIVLQHIANKHQMQYLKDFSRLVKPGGWIIIQLPSEKIFSSILGKIKGSIVNLLPYRLKKKLLILLGNQSRALQEFDFEINTCSQSKIERFAQENRLEIQHIAYTNSCEPDFCGNLLFRTYEEAKRIPGYLSPMYFLKKY